MEQGRAALDELRAHGVQLVDQMGLQVTLQSPLPSYSLDQVIDRMINLLPTAPPASIAAARDRFLIAARGSEA